MVSLVAVAQTLQDLDGVRDGWLRHLHRLEAALQGGVLLDVLAVLSSSVVAPMVCSSPRASFGFRMEAASIAPSAAPAPTSVDLDEQMMSPRWLISLSTFFRRSSKSPR